MKIVLYRAVSAVVAVVVLAASSNAAEGSLDDAKKLYAAASFENALAVLAQIDADASKAPDVLEYKALCLLALGRFEEAQSVVDTLVSTAPTFVPADDDVPPRFIAVLNDIRRRLLPEITKRLFNDARDQFHKKNQSMAKEQFEQVLRLTDDGVWRDSNDAEDLRTLASAFLELVNSAQRPDDPIPSRAADSVPASATSSETVGAAPVVARSHTELQPPIAIEQSMPKWRPTDAVTALRHFTGAVRIRIGKDGHVVGAAIEVATDPDYDKQLLEAARSWRYVPGRRNGEPIEMDKLVTFHLKTF
jgi:tetratricopeptide (TPR) repeat protein